MTHKQITIFHTNDIHSCFDNWSQMVAHINHHRDANTLYVDLGDHADRSNPLTEATFGKGNVELLNAAGVDYATIGNNEGITFSKDQLNHLYDDAQFQVVVANLFDQKGERPDWSIPFTVHTMENGVKIGIIGLTAPFTLSYEQLGWDITSYKIQLENLLPVVKKQVDILVLMSHLGLQKDEEIATEFNEIDVIIGAHTHHVLPNGKWIGNTLIAQAGKHGAFLGEISIEFNELNKQIQQKHAVLHDVKTNAKDSQTDHILKRLEVEAVQLLSEPVATISEPLMIDWHKQTEFGQLLCDAVTEWCGKEIGMLNAGVLLESLEHGLVTKADTHRICPHPINPCVVELTGRELENTIKRALSKEITELELKGFGFRGKVLGVMLFTGIEVNTQSDQLEIFIQNKPLKEEETYQLATLDMYTFGYLFQEITDSKNKQYFMPEFLRDVLVWKLAQIGT
ncbi:bifunctional metallophosphatase/5'-nucleotidase [Halalkalibacter akibai]|uniref:5'-nucleotidase family protein in cluster with NagD-like phosphatase n=1 Tax=Halalkalibacter akibai (strain ATCC 43226 / DSM 21942 / CIP 109018 / JCM 9157 / 1139) TaxID=1236973 RepID=W4QM78_HALA3|nr:bifunctional UDP-sugar hydrolase/5'-nucleotidase [Halalkalibacter akibai]GAE33230.1 5'-nucleotidase family protein in cluster with NagD-like phosphatase [Halalkalibacter akibai JCM 9157]